MNPTVAAITRTLIHCAKNKFSKFKFCGDKMSKTILQEVIQKTTLQAKKKKVICHYMNIIAKDFGTSIQYIHF